MATRRATPGQVIAAEFIEKTVDGAPSAPTLIAVLSALPAPRLLDLCRLFGSDVHEGAEARERLVLRLAQQLRDRLPAVLRELGRDELRAICRNHGLDASPRGRNELQAQILQAAGVSSSLPPPSPEPSDLPQKGQVIHARHRQWLVEAVEAVEARRGEESPLVRLVCLDDDDPGRPLEILWDLELGARVVAPEAHGLGEPARLDPPAHFGAYLHALKWSAVSAADATRFQSPFRAGIKLMAHQLTPLMKALELPRANLFIADDVGLGKTIEAGLILQELILRQQASFVLIAAPASVCLQWQSEMQRRFGLRFEVMTRQFVAWRRQERGFGANPWSTCNRFIVSHSVLRRREYYEPLRSYLGDRARKGLLIFDEAHNAAPASASKYATDTDITRTLRDLAPRFDNRLFLSATPHNGHSNSFSALLEILDPVRFTRGVPVEGKRELAPVMVRRLKRDLRKLGVEQFPRRLLVQLSLTHREEAWHLERRSLDAETGAQGTPKHNLLAPAPPTELLLASLLARYTELCAPASGQGRFPFIHLQQRLLSSPEAFARSIEVHARKLDDKGGPRAAPDQRKLPLAENDARQLREGDVDPETHGVSDEAEAAAARAQLQDASALLPAPSEEARSLLAELRALAARARRAPDAKTLALLAWIREHLCPAVGLPEDTKASRRWSPRRVILFTEYADTKRYLLEILASAVAPTEDGEARILVFHGGMGDDARDQVQQAFNAPPDKHPVRILIATDAAREGVNLQAHCADLFHFDIPWNPSRLEQRNGRIDRTLQPAEEVRCHYFLYPQRPEDQILEAVLRKIEVVQRELGSLGAVLLGHLESCLEHGITAKTRDAIDAIGADARSTTLHAELEDQRDDLDVIRAEIDLAGRRLEASRRLLEVDPSSLQGVVEVGLAMADAAPLAPASPTSDGRPAFSLPPLDRSWDATLDSLRPVRGRDEAFWEWRQKAPRPVTFHPLKTLSEEAEQLHLAHPFVKRILDRFLAQGFGAHDLSRVTAVVAPDQSVVRVVAFARLTLFGAGAARLHDQILPLAAAWSGTKDDIKPYKDRATAVAAISTAERLLAGAGKPPNATLSRRILQHASLLFRALWPALVEEAEELSIEARKGLAERARKESGELLALLRRQQDSIHRAETHLRQAGLFQLQDREQRRQVELDLKHLERRRGAIGHELVSEPAAIEALYEVRMSRLSPVGLVVTWPESMT